MFRWGAVYFLIVFTIGFVLGLLRVVAIEPRFGTRWAELLEMPLMIVAIYFVASWIVQKTIPKFRKFEFLSIGLIAVAMLLVAEAALVVFLRGISVTQYIANRDPVSGAAYLVSLALFAIMPRIVLEFCHPINFVFQHGSNEEIEKCHLEQGETEKTEFKMEVKN